MDMVTVQIASSDAEALGELYERACKLQDGFSRTHKVTVARMIKSPMKAPTIERLLAGIETVLSARGLLDDEARTLDAIRAALRAERPDDAVVAAAVMSATAARAELVAAGMPESMLPALETGDRFVASAGALTAALHDHVRARCPADRLAGWRARTAELARDGRDGFAAEEAARLVDLACRWAAERFAHDEHGGTVTLTGPLADPPSRGRLSIAHLEAAFALARTAHRSPEIAGELAHGAAWLARYWFAFHVVATRRLDRVLGYVAALPMTLDSVLAVLRAGDDARVPADRLAPCFAGQRVCVYIPSVVVRPDCERVAVKNQLRDSFVRGVRWLRDQRVVIEDLLAVGHPDGGRGLLRDHGFVPADDLEARLGDARPRLGGERRLYRLDHQPPHGVFGTMLHAVAFGG